MKSKLLPLALATSVLVTVQTGPLAASELPVIGDASSGTITLDEEHRLGRAWLRVLRARAPQLNDPLVYSYVEDLVYQLAASSELPDRRLSLILLKNPTLNAFAAPGGIIGIHGGLFQYATTEGEFASVLAHELSHLSQRHYASSLEQQRRSLPLQLATLLAGLLIAASTDGDGAVAAIASSQAATQQQRLAFSRQNEREADSVGMQVLIKSGFNPRSMPDMFSRMQKSFRFLGNEAPEFLRTHPITESRIASGLDRANQYPDSGRQDSLSYQLMRARVDITQSEDINRTFAHYEDALKRDPSAANHYAFALAAISSERQQQALPSLQWLLSKQSQNLYFQMLQAEYWLASDNADIATDYLRRLLELYPDNHPLTVLYIQSLRQQQDNQQAVAVLKDHLRLYPESTHLWYQLAEVNGLVNDILGVHRARAEYFLLIGATSKAEQHLNRALKLRDIGERDRVILKERLKETEAVRDSLDF